MANSVSAATNKQLSEINVKEIKAQNDIRHKMIKGKQERG